MAKFDLGKQVGPLPLGAWIAVVGGGLAIGWYFSSGSAKSAGKAEGEVPLTESGVGAGGQQFIYEPPETVDTPSSAITNNTQWYTKAVSHLIAAGYDPGTVISAISKFLSGLTRTAQEQELINRAVRDIGAPPETVPLPDATTPPIKPPTKPIPEPVKVGPKYTIYTIQRGDTPSKITAKFPGRSWFHIFAANDRVGLRANGTPGVMAHPYDVRVGVKLLIPTPMYAPKIPGIKTGQPFRYYTVPAGTTSLTQIGTRFKVHPWNIYTANDIVGMRADGTPGFLRSFSVKPNQRLLIPYQ